MMVIAMNDDGTVCRLGAPARLPTGAWAGKPPDCPRWSHSMTCPCPARPARVCGHWKLDWTDLGRQRCRTSVKPTPSESRCGWRNGRPGCGSKPKRGPEDAPGCVPAAPVDTLDLGNKRPSQGRLQGFGGA